jgi:hypothetical protein
MSPNNWGSAIYLICAILLAQMRQIHHWHVGNSAANEMEWLSSGGQSHKVEPGTGTAAGMAFGGWADANECQKF